MAGAGSSKVPDMSEEFMSAAAEKHKVAIEDEVFQKILVFWEALQELQLLYYCGEASTPRLMAKLEKYREYLRISEIGDPFEEDHVYELMLRKERKILNDITDSDSFVKASTREVKRWLILWKAFVEEEYFGVIRRNFFK